MTGRLYGEARKRPDFFTLTRPETLGFVRNRVVVELYFVALQLDKKFGIVCSPTINLAVFANTVPLLASVTQFPTYV